ncbi:MAG: stage III sporulation protein AE [Clostridia bacterium]|nr:stage III sporulation protein AE [Clostridia bacterium]
MKKIIKTIFLIFIFIVIFCPETIVARQDTKEVEQKLEQNVQSQLDKLDFSDAESVVEQLGIDVQGLFGSSSFSDKVEKVLSGDFIQDTNGFLNAFFKLLFEKILSLVPVLVSISVVAILCGLISQIKSGFVSDSTGQIVFFVCFSIIILLVITCATNLLNQTNQTIVLLKRQMNFAFPVLLTLMAGIGGVVSVRAYQPAVALLSGGIVEIVSNVILPMFIFSFVFSIVANLSKNVKLTKLTEFFKSATTTILVVTFTLFTAFLSIQGLTAGAFDSISIRAAKFATKSYVPILGGYLSDGFDLIMASSVLIKNSVGVAGLILLVCTILSPIIQILSLSFGLKFVSAIIEPVTDEKITSFLYSVSKHLNMLIVAILAVSFMYFICIMLLIFTSNAFF